jgi:uncharacterized protein (TIGR02996 family)
MKIDAIYDAPGDLALRSVFADELQEKGDPRGEFIALQIANADPPKQRALIAKHGAKWAGKLAKEFEELHFENGFFAGGMLRMPKRKNMLEEWPKRKVDFDDPAWRLVTVLGSKNQEELLELAAEKALVSLRGLYELYPSSVAELPRAFEELGVSAFGDDDDDARDALGKLSLSSLALFSADDFEPLAGSKAFRSLTRLIVGRGGKLDGVVRAAAKAPKLLELAINTDDGFPLSPGGWTVRLLRESAAFTRVEGTYRAAKERGSSPDSVIRPLRAIPPKPVKSIKLDAARAMTLELAAREQLSEVLATFTKAEITVPWEAPESRVEATGGSFMVHAWGRGLLGETKKVTALTKLVAELDQTYDKLQSNGGALRKLTDPKQVITWAENKGCKGLTLRNEATGASVSMGRGYATYTSAQLVGISDPEALVEWFVRFVGLSEFTMATLDPSDMDRPRTHMNFPAPAWLVFVGGEQAEKLSLAKVKKLAKARATKHGIVIEAEADASNKSLVKLHESLYKLTKS